MTHANCYIGAPAKNEGFYKHKHTLGQNDNISGLHCRKIRGHKHTQGKPVLNRDIGQELPLVMPQQVM